MSYETFVPKNFRGESLVTIETAKDIIAEYKGNGYTLTLRQLYYQFVARGLRENTERSYKSLGKLITDARLSGDISWDAIEDRGRNVTEWLIEEEEREVLYGIERGFAMDYWTPQNTYIEVWIEKDALSSVLRRPCMRWKVPYMPCKGYLSASEMYRAAKRFEEAYDDGKNCVLIHLGDHDPSGVDMTRDNADRLELMSNDSVIDVRRIALNMDQVRRYNPPPNPAKITDSRAEDYIAKHGRISWELDALEPSVIEDLVQNEIEGFVDHDKWSEVREEERERRKRLECLYENWEEIAEHISETY